ncbi:MAG: RES family NAD+ phosphorylase [Burkholderiaceae bacterium]|nr:RES family NAD+ phosphorylase [Burkholderiaceae bacterium]
MVEAQHVASTMKLVDDRDEQDLLESLLESSKPALASGTERLDYLLATPFRYPARHGGSRFRGATDPGVFYGAESVHTAAAELGYWRWRFLRDAVDLDRLAPVAHTAFRADIATEVVDLREPPLSADAAAWRHPDDYSATQAFARVAREAGLGGIVYGSVRDPRPGWCLALLTPAGFARTKPQPRMQTWFLAVSAEDVTWRREGASMRFEMSRWVEPGFGGRGSAR